MLNPLRLQSLHHRGMVGEAQQVTGKAATLVEVATECQREIAKIIASPAAEAKYFNDGTWSEGLVSAAKMVAEVCVCARMC